jgi:endoglucanase
MKNKIYFFVAVIVFASCNPANRINVVNTGNSDSAFKFKPISLERIMGEPIRTETPEYEMIPAQQRTIEPVTVKTPFSKGVNFTGWLETESAESINYSMYTEQDFADVKNMGVDVIRLPVKMHPMTSGTPNYTLDPLLLRFLDMAVNWAEKYRLYLIIDNHSFHPINHTPNDIDKILLPVWAQIAQRYKDRSNFIVYEILNEPHGISDARWGEVQGMAIDTIRRIDQKHAIIVGGTDFNSIGKLSAMPKYSDPNLIYTFHFYDPHVFTHQGASWGEPSMAALAGVPFPYDRSRMPRTPNNLRETWIESALNDYQRSSSSQTLNATLDRVVAFSKERNVPVFCGEFGVLLSNSRHEDRVRWYEFTTDALDRRNISRTSWDYFGGFGIFNSNGFGDVNYDLNIGVVKAMGFNPPEQKIRVKEPVRSGFTIFDDYPNRQFVTAGHWGDTVFSMFDRNAAEGEFAIRWGNVDQYNMFWFGFYNNDFSILAAQGYFLEFKARAEKPVNFDVRFVNPETASSTPWRIRYTINQNVLPPDGKWHTIRVPLSEMQEHGAWINATSRWVGPKGEFTWSNVNQLEFVAEHGNIRDNIWFDSIKITR